MMYLQFCRQCSRIHILSGHKPFCPACGARLRELSVSFADFSGMSLRERSRLLESQVENECP